MDRLMDVMSKAPFAVNRKITREIFKKALREAGVQLPPHQLHVLKVLYTDKEMEISELEEELALARPQISHCINDLIKADLVTRKTGNKDKRRASISITKKGKKKIDKLNQKISEKIRDFLSSLDNEELEKLADSFEYISEKISKL